MFRRRGDDLTVGVLEAGSVALVAILAALEIRQACIGSVRVPAWLEFSEATLQVLSLAVIALATMQIATRLNRPVLLMCWRVLGCAAIGGGVLLILANPLLTGASVGTLPILDWLLPATCCRQPWRCWRCAIRRRANPANFTARWRCTLWPPRSCG